MTRTERGEKGPGHEYWSRRYIKTLLTPGRWAKKLTHKYERRKAQLDIESEKQSLTSDDESMDCKGDNLV